MWHSTSHRVFQRTILWWWKRFCVYLCYLLSEMRRWNFLLSTYHRSLPTSAYTIFYLRNPSREQRKELWEISAVFSYLSSPFSKRKIAEEYSLTYHQHNLTAYNIVPLENKPCGEFYAWTLSHGNTNSFSGTFVKA